MGVLGKDLGVVEIILLFFFHDHGVVERHDFLVLGHQVAANVSGGVVRFRVVQVVLLGCLTRLFVVVVPESGLHGDIMLRVLAAWVCQDLREINYLGHIVRQGENF